MFEFIKTVKRLFTCSVAVATVMFTTYFLPEDSFISTLIIYAPISLLILDDCVTPNKFSLFTSSSILSVVHGWTHYNYRFLSSENGVDRWVEGVTIDQCIHLIQAFLFLYLCKTKSNSFFVHTFGYFIVTGNIFALYLANNCFHALSNCYDLFVQYSIFQSFASGLHFAIGAQGPIQEQSFLIFLIQGIAALAIRSSFISSSEIIKVFARARFFESYFIVPHVIGFVEEETLRIKRNEWKLKNK